MTARGVLFRRGGWGRFLYRNPGALTLPLALGPRATPDLAQSLGASERRLRDVLKRRAKPRGDLRNRIIAAAKAKVIR
jgi:hypothetical protein